MILAFVYGFPHFKSAQGLYALKRAGFDNVTAIAAPWKKLDIRESHFQFKTHGMPDAHHPREVCANLGYKYIASQHDSPKAIELARKAQYGIILGARVLSPSLVNNAPPIVNLHPGVLPHNRGLDTLKWAVHDGLPQAVTTHIIDDRIDRGIALREKLVPVYGEDSYADIYNRMMWTQIEMIDEHVFLSPDENEAIGKGTYRKPMTLHEDVLTKSRFSAYKHNYRGIMEGWYEHGKAA